MTEEIIGMEDMMQVYEITDRFDIDRENITVPLEKTGNGLVTKEPGGKIEITVPATIPISEWLGVLQTELERLGFVLQNITEE